MRDLLKHFLDEGHVDTEQALRELEARAQRRAWKGFAMVALAGAAAAALAVLALWPRQPPPTFAEEDTLIRLPADGEPEVELDVQGRNDPMLPVLLAAMAVTPDLSMPMTVELRDAPAQALFDKVSDALHAPVRVNAPLGDKKVSLKLRNAPVSSVLDVVTGRLNVRYRQENGALIIEPLDAKGPAVVAAAAAAPNAACPTPPEEVVTLRARVAELETLVLSLRKDYQAVGGAVMPWPADLPPRLRDANQLQQAFNAALREGGFAKGEVTKVDCNEYPCVVFGRGFGERGDYEKIQDTAPFAAYAKDSQFVWGWNTSRDGGGSENYVFAVVLSPPGTRISGEQRKRLDVRIAQQREGREKD
jgi:hypothetical protein